MNTNFNELIVAAVTRFSGTTSLDKNGEPSVMFQCVAGKMPLRNVISGTLAARGGFEVGKVYLINVRFQGHDKVFGDDYNFLKVKELTGLEVIEAKEKLGEPVTFTVERPKGFEEIYDRKSSKVIGLRTMRIAEGQYIPASQATVTNTGTAKEIIEGSSTEGEENLPSEDDLPKSLKKDGDNKKAA